MKAADQIMNAALCHETGGSFITSWLREGPACNRAAAYVPGADEGKRFYRGMLAGLTDNERRMFLMFVALSEGAE